MGSVLLGPTKASSKSEPGGRQQRRKANRNPCPSPGIMQLGGLSRSPSHSLSFHERWNPFWRCWWAGSAPRFLFPLHPHGTTHPRQEMSPSGQPHIQRPGRCLAHGHRASWAWAARGKGAPAHTGGCPTGHHVPLGALATWGASERTGTDHPWSRGCRRSHEC